MVSIELTKALERSDTIAAARRGLRAANERITVAGKSLDLTTTLSMTGTAAQTSANEQDFTGSDSSNLALTVKKPIYDGGLADAGNRCRAACGRTGAYRACPGRTECPARGCYRPMSIWLRRVIVSFWKRPM